MTRPSALVTPSLLTNRLFRTLFAGFMFYLAFASARSPVINVHFDLSRIPETSKSARFIFPRTFELLNLEPPSGIECSEAVERLERLERLERASVCGIRGTNGF